MKSKGTSIISNESLRTNILRYYSYAEGIGTSSPLRYSKFVDDAIRTIYPKFFDEIWPARWIGNEGQLEIGNVTPNDYEELKKSKEFRFFLKSLRNQNYWLIEIATGNILGYYSDIEKELDKEIEKLKN